MKKNGNKLEHWIKIWLDNYDNLIKDNVTSCQKNKEE